MTVHVKYAFSVLLFYLLANGAVAQVSQPNVIKALRIDDPIKVDGDLSEPAWYHAEHISNFTQRELNEGAPATERTEVAIVYDQDNLYIGVWCYDREPDKLIAKKMSRDFRWNGEDNFEIIIDTFGDRRNGFLFVTNPNGARADALVLENGRQRNKDWDGVWTVKTRITEQGWFAEFWIPFSTLRFSSAREQVWGINFERNIRRKREQVLWQGWSRDSDLEQVARAGKLVGLKGISSVKLVEVKPYGITGFSVKPETANKGVGDVGGDLNYLITPTMKLNLTVNTDFAQVESDRVQINLTRFSLFYPEKREFFLEGRNYFDFGMGHAIQPFYTRRIGLAPDRTEIPIIAGARLLGKTGRTTLGGMSIQTAAKGEIPPTNYPVLRWKQDIWSESTVGLIGVSKIEPNRQNVVYGSDFLYSTTDFLGDKNLQFGGAFAQSYTSDADRKFGESHRIFISYPSDFVEFDAVWSRVSKDFNPETGFLYRKNYQMFYSELQFNPRPAFLPWIRRLVFKPLDFNYYIDDVTHELQTFKSEYRPLGFSTKSGEFFEFNIQRSAENLPYDFEIHDGVVIPRGEYWFTHYEIQMATFSGRPLFGYGSLNWGNFYDGKRTRFFGRLVWRWNKHFSMSADYTRNDIQLPGGNFVVNEFGSRLEFAVNPDLFGSLFGQWNNDDKEVLLNFRMNWIPTPGTNFYFVVNQSFNTTGGSWATTNTTVLTKLIWRFVL